jgi:SAM-dependent methyltransferase
MDLKEIESEIRRLSPWYYLYDLRGVRTDITPPFDHWGHRNVKIPDQVAPYVQGKTLLDVGCNEGQWGFAALTLRCQNLVGFDCRPINVEKARFVARVLGIKNAIFQVGSVDSWPDEDKYDVVFMCGVLYHLPEPWNAVRKYCGIAREGILVTTMLHGGADGYSPRYEGESIGSCEIPAIPSMTPNTSQTVVDEYAKYGFVPIYVVETKFNKPSPQGVVTRVPPKVTDVGSCNIFFRKETRA